MNRSVILVGIGGMLGSVARFLLASLLTRAFPSAFPYGTFAVNVIGCLAIGLVFGCAERFEWMTAEWRVFLATGLCGGFTTFSSFSFENLSLLRDGDFLTFGSYSLLSFTFGLAATFLGLVLTRG
jgi:fluoride exporter